MKKENIKLGIYFSVVLLIICLPLFLDNIPSGFDINFHLSRIRFIAENMENQIFFSPFYFIHNWAYGEAFFYPDLFLYLPALIYHLSKNLVFTYKVVFFFINILTLISVYYSTTKLTKNKKMSIFLSTLYLLFPYRLSILYVHFSLAEASAFIFFPLIFYSFYEVLQASKKQVPLLIFSMSCLILVHLLSVVTILPILLILFLFHLKKMIKTKKTFLYLLFSSLLVIGITAFFSFPLFEQLKNGQYKFYYPSVLSNHTMSFFDLFINFSVKEEPYRPLGVGISLFVMIIFLLFHFNKAKKKTKLIFILSLFVIVLPTYLFPWKIFNHTFSVLQFPYRFLGPASFLLIMGIGLFLQDIKIKQKIIYPITVVLSFLPLVFIYTYTFQLERNSSIPYSIAWAEYLPYDFPLKVIKDYVVLDNSYSIKSKYDVNIKHQFLYPPTMMKILFDHNLNLENIFYLPMIYYKGYHAYIGKREIPLDKSKGLIAIKVSEEKGEITIKYEMTKVQFISKIISILSLIIFVFYAIYQKKSIN